MKKVSLKEKTEKELATELSKAREVLRESRFAMVGLKAKTLKEARFAKKQVAQILTEVQARLKGNA